MTPNTDSLFPTEAAPKKPEKLLVAHVDGGARGNPGPAGFGVVLEDERGQKVDQLSGYLGHQTNNVAEYSGLLAALDYAVKHGHRAMRVVADSELLVKQIKGEYKVRAPQLQDLYSKARVMIRSLEWFRIEHTLRGGNKEADALANEAMDRGMGRKSGESPRPSEARQYEKQPAEVNGIVKDGVVQFLGTKLPDGTFVKVRVK
ncbi:MAG TPA: ribonuclease HI family protein [Candidatus Koribacter sp.]|jgi:ribonuclease HI